MSSVTVLRAGQIEKGMGPRPMGGYWMEISMNRDSTINRKIYET